MTGQSADFDGQNLPNHPIDIGSFRFSETSEASTQRALQPSFPSGHYQKYLVDGSADANPFTNLNLIREGTMQQWILEKFRGRDTPSHYAQGLANTQA